MSRNGQRLPQRKAAERRESMTSLVDFINIFLVWFALQYFLLQTVDSVDLPDC